MKRMQHTLKESFTLSGIGLHSGAAVTVRVLPATLEAGRYFVRTDLPKLPVIPAQVAAVSQTTLSTELACGEGRVRTVEHLLAAIAASGIDCARVEIDGPEIPLLDGSAAVWTGAIAKAGQVELGEGSGEIAIQKPLWLQEGDAWVGALPAAETRFSYGIDFPDYPAIANQWHSWSPAREDFATEIAPARTFGLAEQVEQLRQAGLIQGGSLENALVCDRNGWLNPPLRFVNEPARHKLLDLIGDLSLLGTIPQAHFIAYKASHKLHVALARAIAPLLYD